MAGEVIVPAFEAENTDDAALLRKLTELTLSGVLAWNGSDRDGYWCQPEGAGRVFELTVAPVPSWCWRLLVRRAGLSAGPLAAVRVGWWNEEGGLVKAVRESAAVAHAAEVREGLDWLDWLDWLGKVKGGGA